MLTKKRLLSILWILTCLVLWVLGFLWISFILMLMGWYIVVKDYPLRKKIARSIGIGFLFIIFYIVTNYRIFELKTDFSQPCWSPDGKQIAFFMTKSLFRVHPGVPFSAWTAEDLWKKHYLCTMDYDGENFKVVKQTNYLGRILWSGSGNIVYSEEKYKDIVEKGIFVKKIEAVAYKIHPDGTSLEEIWKWNEKSEYQDVYWLSPGENYLVLYANIDKTRGFSVYDIRKGKVITEKLYPSSKNVNFYGSYKDNQIAINEEGKVLLKYILDTDEFERIILTPEVAKEEDRKLLADFAMPTLSPDRSMYARAGGVWTVDNKVVSSFYIKPKRSYLFNIFWK